MVGEKQVKRGAAKVDLSSVTSVMVGGRGGQPQAWVACVHLETESLGTVRLSRQGHSSPGAVPREREGKRERQRQEAWRWR